MAQKTAWNAAALTEADINLHLMGEGGAWTSWTPTITQSVNVTFTNTRSRFARYGRTIVATVNLAVTGTGTAGNIVTISLPVTAAASATIGGSGVLIDSSASLNYGGLVELSSTTAFAFIPSATNGVNYLGVTGFTAALASGDIIRAIVTYEAAS